MLCTSTPWLSTGSTEHAPLAEGPPGQDAADAEMPCIRNGFCPVVMEPPDTFTDTLPLSLAALPPVPPIAADAS
jgi:hypothetical protein